ncbi:MAG TPA: hypothetical protein VJY62_14500 [Bacteroidia bacterium]|nr:hypothetical protein [Bacteroidia bacterium]
MSPSIADNEEEIKEVKKEGFSRPNVPFGMGGNALIFIYLPAGRFLLILVIGSASPQQSKNNCDYN